MTLRWRQFLLLALIGAALCPGGVSASAQAVEARLAEDGRSVILSAPGIEYFRGGFSAWINDVPGTNYVLSSESGSQVGRISTAVENTPYGMATVQRATFEFKEEQMELLFRLDKMAGVPVVLLQAGIRNRGRRPVSLDNTCPLVMQPDPSDESPVCSIQVSGKLSDWFLTGLHPATPVLSALDELRKKETIHEYGGCYRSDGTGFLFGPVGTPVAYVGGRVMAVGKGRIGLTLSSKMNNVRVRPGETRWGQQMALFMEPPAVALARWADWVAKTHGACTSKGSLSGWNSSFRGLSVSGSNLLDVADQVLKSEGRLRPGTIQIEDVFQSATGGPLETNERFPEGLAFYAKRIAETGARPGLRLVATRYPYGDWTNFVATAQQAVRMGFTHLKIYERFRNVLPDKTDLEFTREGFRKLREAVGDDVYLQNWHYVDGGHFAPSRVSVGFVDASNTGKQIGQGTARAVIEQVLRSYHLNGRWFAVNNDYFYMATELKDVRPFDGGWPLARTWISMVGLSCGVAVTSDPWNEERFKPYWRNVEVLTPPAREHTEVLDICTAREWPRLVGHVKRDWGDSTVVLLWNPAEKEQTVTLDFARIGLDPKHHYAVWSFWDNRFMGVAEGSWTTPFLAPSASQHLCFTDLDRDPGRPALIGSGLHIYCGAADIKQVTALRSAMQIELTDAGARSGDLFLYSQLNPVFKDAVGCEVAGITAAGENVWRIAVKDRRHGVAQRIELDIPLPLTSQVWFWGLVGVTLASLFFGAWRYLVYLKLQRVHARDRERARIARDLHDDLGANLSEIAMMSELAKDELPADDPTRAHFGEISERASSNVRRLSDIVWAINPANDTLEGMAGFLCKFAQDYLARAQIRCRLDVPETMPNVLLDSVQRHNLALAVKEAVHNAVRHGAPSEVLLGIATGGGRITITVRDNGRGFDTTRDVVENHGSTNMRVRMEQMGGAFARQSVPGQGTTVVFTVPFTAPRSSS